MATSAIHGLPENHPGPTKLLRIGIYSAKDLAKKDIFGLSDPYVLFSLCRRSQSGNLKKIYTAKTKTIKRNLNPVWDMQAICRVDPTANILLFELFDANRITRDDFLGLVEIPLMGTDIPTLPPDTELVPTSHVLRQRNQSYVRGSINIALAFVADRTDGAAPEPALVAEENEDGLIEVSTERRSTQQVTDLNAPMPPGWEARRDANGRVYYVNHISRTTTWQRPSVRTEGTGAVNETTTSNANNEAAPSTTENSPVTSPTVEILPASTPGAAAAESTGPRRVPSRRHISARDVEPTTAVSAAPTPRIELLTTGEDEEPLPPGWQKARAPNGRIFFVDHNTQGTTWQDPRTGQETSQPESTKEAPSPGIDAAYQKSPLDDAGAAALSEAEANTHLGPLPEGWERRISESGRPFFVDHKSRRTQWEDPRLAQYAGPRLRLERTFKAKYDNFRANLRLPPNLPNKVDIEVRRSDILQDAFNIVMSTTDVNLLKARLWVSFRGEQGLDYSGVKREFFWLLSKAMFNPYYGLFMYSAVDNYTLQINPNSSMAEPNHLQWYYFIGRITGMAVFHGYLLDGFFVRPFYKLILDKPLTLNDMECTDVEYYNSLQYILENDVSELDLHFIANDADLYGKPVEAELVPGGSKTKVINENKDEYVHLLIDYRLKGRIGDQMHWFMTGFFEFIPRNLLQEFDEHELELLLGGIQNIDVNDWRENTEYRNGYSPNHVTIVNFWKLVYLMSNHQRTRLLQWVTGTSKLPANGFRDLQGSNGPQRFTIQLWSDRGHLPQAHTCFNRLELPPYEQYDELREKIFKALEMGREFSTD